MNVIQDRIIDIFKKTLDEQKEIAFSGDVKKINHFNMLTKAGGKDALYKIMKCNMCMLKCLFEQIPAVLIIFSIPINEKTGSKLIADRVMEIVEIMEECFITIDYMNSKEQRDEKFIYVTMIKKIGECEDAKYSC